MILTNSEIMDINQNAEFDSAIGYARKIESAVLEKLKEQEPVAFTNSAQLGYVKDGMHPDIPLAMWATNTTYSGANIKLYTHPLPPDDVVRDAERYRWLRDTLSKSVGGGVEVNDAALVYEESEQGEEVHVYWYPDTPIGFYEIKAKTLDAAIDAAMKDMK